MTLDFLIVEEKNPTAGVLFLVLVNKKNASVRDSRNDI